MNFKPRTILRWLVTLVTLGSGAINLYSVIGPNLPERQAILEGFFPLEFLHLSRFLTVLIGFALVISSINIYKRKTRAWWSAVLLASASIVFHFTKGLDYEEATLSLVLLVLLLFARKIFTVKSSIPDWRWGLLRFGVAVLAAFAYGVAGFWFLEPHEFGISFHWNDAIRRTFEFLSLQPDPQIVPQTHYARWFLDSLNLITVTTIGYSLFALFHPVIYRFRTTLQERNRAAEIVRQHGRSSLDYFKSWPDKSIFFAKSQNSFIAYRVGANFAVALGDPVGPEAETEQTLREFMEFCQQNDWGVAFHQTLPDFLELYQKCGLRKLKIGDDAIVDLTQFKLEGKVRKEFRHTVNKMEKSGIQTRLYEPPVPEEALKQLKEVSDEWLQIPGRRERRFTLGWFDPDYIRTTPVFVVADKDDRIFAFVNIIPSYTKGEATIDLMRRKTEAPHGIMDYLFVKLLLHLKERGYTRFNFGMAPMSGFQEKEEASPEEKAIHYFFQHLNFIFSYTGLRAYKAKFASFWEPRYDVLRSLLDLPRLGIALSKVAEMED
ncbi:MAG: phosphatidylglycerol lysyltransferase domain-containing protein [candidate division KSB1 bacterium]|nr:phosphatidylglycerol lysyltransferase domain-containing protein [candidate division KSB1 bacterium]MDZ7364554.1 phosphatidylglycerol lysyltransferase domain-containing protein [candidate division KSB1 bacterium]MDZ7405743.1 phosphatidylglycerol lysyltransferase domain-containing protein [candidate division KSB1 bacterium]